MKIFIVFFVFSFCFFASGQSNLLQIKGHIVFISDASLEIIKAKSDKMEGVINLVQNKFAFSVRLRSFDGFNSSLQQEHFNENYMESDKFPFASYSGKLLDPLDLSKDASYQVRTKGIFTIHGISMERILKHDIIIKNKLLSLKSSFTIFLEDYNINIPSIINKKIAKEINVSIDAQLSL